MSLSIIILCLLPIFLIPAFVITNNRIRIYFSCSSGATIVVLIIAFVAWLLPEHMSDNILASPFAGISNYIHMSLPYLSSQEVSHIIVQFEYLIIYLVVYLLVYLFFKIFFIGSNPAIRKPIKVIGKIAYGLGFFICTFLPLSLFLINIRLLLPFQDGFLNDFFNLIYYVGA